MDRSIDQRSELASTRVTCLSNEDGGMDFCARAGGRRGHLGLLLQSPRKAEDLGHFGVPDVEDFACDFLLLLPVRLHLVDISF